MADRPPLLSLDEAQSRLVQGAQPLAIRETQELSTFDALGRVLAQDVFSPLDVPPADNSSMDGYAVRAADVQPGVAMPVSQRIPAGHVGQALQPGTAARIFTGAQLPAGADAVVMQEDATAGEGTVSFAATPAAGQWVRPRGEDVRVGAVVLPRGSRLTPQALGLAATVGAARLTVLRRPRVALLSTGDELVMPGEVAPQDLPPGAIYNSNRFTLRGLLQAAGCDVTDFGIVPDKLDATRETIRHAAAGHDLILTTGGVSVGEEDHVKPAVQALGRLDMWSIATKPGKPLAFGAVRREGDGAGEALFLGLPGNPVSTYITFFLAVRSVLCALQGLPTAFPRGIELTADFDLPKPDRNRREFLRARVGEDGLVKLFPNQSSGVLTSAVWADGLVDNPPGTVIRPGDRVRYLPLSGLLASC
ncbi:molybdopterin molybdotransferase MoeA [Azohydromonas aeria]|uniref:molybdopterin molybdotransferase MoeA n=1 Tax=Azohydromonas aeria TaxID=2590212 RepID=UPI0012FC7F51|nr:gephyrin-like molybdotransferase Glp [Azohydromonas aeria]